MSDARRSDDDRPPPPRLRVVRAGGESGADDREEAGIVVEAVWHGGGAEKDWDALLRLIFDPIVEQLHDADRPAPDAAP